MRTAPEGLGAAAPASELPSGSDDQLLNLPPDKIILLCPLKSDHSYLPVAADTWSVDFVNQHGCGVKIAGHAAFGINVAKDAFRLLGCESNFWRNFGRAIAVAFAIKHQVHDLVWQAEIEFLLCLRQ